MTDVPGCLSTDNEISYFYISATEMRKPDALLRRYYLCSSENTISAYWFSNRQNLECAYQ